MADFDRFSLAIARAVLGTLVAWATKAGRSPVPGVDVVLQEPPLLDGERSLHRKQHSAL
jgi:hypothetical protein